MLLYNYLLFLAVIFKVGGTKLLSNFTLSLKFYISVITEKSLKVYKTMKKIRGLSLNLLLYIFYIFKIK